MRKLAIQGGDPVRVKPFPAWPQWDEAEERALLEALDHGQWGTLGDRAIRLMETATFSGAKYQIAVTNGTMALELILRGLGIGYGDEVIVPAYTFVAAVSAVAMAGATPVLADVERSGCGIDARSVLGCITERTRAVIAVHYAGCPCDMDAIGRVAQEHGLAVIEDASSAVGAVWRGTPAGSLGDAAAFSFQCEKNVTAGEGGWIATNRRELYETCWHYHHSGRALEGASEFGGLTLMGTNARMTEWQAAILECQLRRLPAQLEARGANAALLRERLSALPSLRLPDVDARVDVHTYHLFPAHFAAEGMGCTRDEFVRALNAEGIPAQAGYRKLNTMGFLEPENANFRKSTGTRRRYDALELPNADAAAADHIVLHGSVLLGSRADMADVVRGFEKVTEGYVCAKR